MAILFAAACVAQATPPPSASGTPATVPALPGPTQRQVAAAPSSTATPVPDVDLGCADLIATKPEPYSDPTFAPPPAPTIRGGDADVRDAITRAVDELAALHSYQFTVDVAGRDIIQLAPTTIDLGMQGTIDQTNGLALDAVFGTRLREPDGSAAVTSGGSRIVAGGGYAWETDNVSGVLEPTSDAATVEGIALVTPEGFARRVIVPFAAGFRRLGPETHGGQATIHYRRSTGGERAYADALQFDGDVSADLWIAADGRYLAAARIAGQGKQKDATSGVEYDDAFLLAFDVSKANDPANLVQLPVLPVPDPVRPSHAPVDLRLEYQVLPAGGVHPTPQDLDAIGAAIRVRLDISRRPVKVDTLEPDRVGVTICGSTDPDADRRVILAHGALTVVPLPPSTYGTAASPGGTALPAAGTQIGPSLPPIAPPARAGLTTAHVDPATGRRGLAIHLSNEATDAFLAFATTHQGEYVALVLDGTVLATLPIDGQTRNGNFVFTGDYTEAETHLMASYLYQDPIRFDLQPTADIEVPSR